MAAQLDKVARRARAADLIARAFDEHQGLAKRKPFDESKVNRDEDGKFAEKPGSGSSKTPASEAAAAKEAFLADFREAKGQGYETLKEKVETSTAGDSPKGKPKGVNWTKLSQQKASKPPKKARDVIEIPKNPYREKREMVIGDDTPSKEMTLGRRAYAWKSKVTVGDDVEIFKTDYSGRVNALVMGFDPDGSLLVRRRFSQNRPSNRTVKVSPKNVTKHIPLKDRPKSVEPRKVTLTVGDNISFTPPKRKRSVNGRILGFTSDGQVQVRRAAPRSASGAYKDETIHPRHISSVFAVKFALFDDLMKWGGQFDESKVKRDEDGKFSEQQGAPVDETYRGTVEREGGMLGANLTGGAVYEGGSQALRGLKQRMQSGSRAKRIASRFVPGGFIGRNAVLAVPAMTADLAGRTAGEGAGRAVDVSIFGDRNAAEAQRLREEIPIEQQKLPEEGTWETVGFFAGNYGGTLAGAKAGAAVGSIFAPGVGTVAGGLIGAGIGGYLGESVGTKAGSWYDRRQRAEKMVSAIYALHAAYELHKAKNAPKGGNLVHVPAHTRTAPDGSKTQVEAYSYPKGGGAKGQTRSTSSLTLPSSDKRLKQALSVGRSFLRDQAGKARKALSDKVVRERVITIVSEGADVIDILTGGSFDLSTAKQIGDALDASMTVAELYLEKHRDKVDRVSRQAKRLARRIAMRKAAGLTPQQQQMYERLEVLGEEDPEAAEFIVAMFTLLDREELQRLFELNARRKAGGISEDEEVEMATIMAILHERYHDDG